MRISPRGIELVKQFEGCKLTAYVCPAGVLTIGYGSTGPHVKAGMKIDGAQANTLLLKDLERFEAGVNRLSKKHTQGQFDALVSFAFNLGLGNLEKSTLLKLHNAGKHTEAADQFKRWNKAGGKVLAGLTRRREAEAALYLS